MRLCAIIGTIDSMKVYKGDNIVNECYGCGEKTRVMLDGMCRICAA